VSISSPSSFKLISIGGRRFYLIDNELYESVTSLIRRCLGVPEALKEWIEAHSPEERAYYALRGKITHFRILSRLAGYPLPLDFTDQERALLKTPHTREKLIRDVDLLTSAWRDLEEKLGIKEVIGVEKLVLSRKYRYAGRPDIICTLRSGPAIIDIKTREQLRTFEEHHWQLRLYRQALTEEGLEAKTYLAILSTDGSSTLIEVEPKPIEELLKQKQT